MSSRIEVHPFSVMLGAIAVAGAALLAGGGGPAGTNPVDYMSMVQVDDGFGNMIDTVRFTGCNLQVVNGLDDTETINGAGNLIVGYNEPLAGPGPSADRTGSHNIVGGVDNNYSSYGGLVVGTTNEISGQYASVSGGSRGSARGDFSSISGGWTNRAEGFWSSVVGGSENSAYAIDCTISGGNNNEANGGASSISGGCNLIADQDCQHLPCNHCPTDTNADGVVDVDDLVAIIVTWGTVCP